MKNEFTFMKKAMACLALLAVLFVSACDDEESKSSDTDISLFSINDVEFTIDLTAGTLTNETLFVFGTDVTAMVATFTVPEGASVTVGDTPQESGVTVNDFSSPVVYTVMAENGSSIDFTVSVGVKTSAWEQVATEAFALMQSPSAAVLNDKIYLVGSVEVGGDYYTPGEYYEFVYSSTDGSDWTVDYSFDGTLLDEMDSVPLGNNAALIGYNGSLFNIGGIGAPGVGSWGQRDYPSLGISTSSDGGLTWTTTSKEDAGVTAIGSKVVEMGGDLYIIGSRLFAYGAAQTVPILNIYKSSNGTSWTTEAEHVLNGIGETTTFYSSFVFNDEMYVTGGVKANWLTPTSALYYSTVFKSADGITWSAVEAEGFPVIAGHTVVSYKDKLVAIGGAYGDDEVANYTADVYVSDDGIIWTKQEEGLALPEDFEARAFHNTVVMNDKIYIIGGEGIEGDLNDVWVGEFAF